MIAEWLSLPFMGYVRKLEVGEGVGPVRARSRGAARRWSRRISRPSYPW